MRTAWEWGQGRAPRGHLERLQALEPETALSLGTRREVQPEREPAGHAAPRSPCRGGVSWRGGELGEREAESPLKMNGKKKKKKMNSSGVPAFLCPHPVLYPS